MMDSKTTTIIIIAILMGLSGYFGYYQFQQSLTLQQEKSDLEQQTNDLLAYSSSLDDALAESQAKEREYISQIDELSYSLNYYKTQANIASFQNQDLEERQSNSLTPPYTLIQERKIIWVFEDSRGNSYQWEMPFDTYRSIIESPEPQDIRLLEADDGTVFSVRDYTKFVQSNSFSNVIDDLYENAGSDYQFLYEVWYITSQLTTYSSDIGDDPRWALETFTEGGGDCEDLTILIASMLKASSHTGDWTIELLYFDSDNPNRPQDIDHVALSVQTDEFETVVESTVKVNGLDYWQSLRAWRFEV